MPSIHNRKYDLYSPSSRKHSKPIIPVARLTRSDIESRLQQSIEINSKINKYIARNEKQRFHTIPTSRLFRHDPEIQLPSTSATTTTRNNNNDSNEPGNLSLRKVPKYSLYRQVTETEAETTPILTFNTAAYIRKRQEILDEQRDSRVIDSVEETTEAEIPSLITTQDVLQEVLSDSVLNTPVTPPSTTTAEQPLPQEPSTVSAPQRATTSLGLIPEQFVPIMATTMQRKGCDTMRRITQTRDSSRMKINFEDMIGLLNHPLVALRDEYEETVDDKWSGSGKTLFIKQFVEYTQNEQLVSIYVFIRLKGKKKRLDHI